MPRENKKEIDEEFKIHIKIARDIYFLNILKVIFLTLNTFLP